MNPVRGGGTLIELLISIALMGIIASVVVLAVRRFTPPAPNDPLGTIADSLMKVVETGRGMTLQFSVDDRPAFATLNPDGSVIADSVIHVERLTGQRVVDAR